MPRIWAGCRGVFLSESRVGNFQLSSTWVSDLAQPQLGHGQGELFRFQDQGPLFAATGKTQCDRQQGHDVFFHGAHRIYLLKSPSLMMFWTLRRTYSRSMRTWPCSRSEAS